MFIRAFILPDDLLASFFGLQASSETEVWPASDLTSVLAEVSVLSPVLKSFGLAFFYHNDPLELTRVPRRSPSKGKPPLPLNGRKGRWPVPGFRDQHENQ